MKPKTTIRLRQRLKNDVSTTESGMTRRGNCILRTIVSCLRTASTERSVASRKKLNSIRFISRNTG